MKLSEFEVQAAGRALFEAERERRQIGLLSLRHPQMGMADAYAIQRAFVAEKKKAGGVVRGWKIGLTSRAMQQALGIDVPDSGVLFEDMFLASGETVPQGRFIEPRIEAEIAFVMGRDLKGPGASMFDVLKATDYVTPALEILDTRIRRRDEKTGRARNVFDTISDNAANAGIVIGGPVFRPDSLNLAHVGAAVARNGHVEETGLGAGVLGNPLTSMVWLVNRLAEYGDGLRAGDVVLSGSFIRPIEAPSGSTITADYGDFGIMGCHFA